MIYKEKQNYDQCKEIEENNRMGKTRDLFKIIRDTKGTLHTLEKEMAAHSSSCLENPRDGGAWWAAVYGVAQSQT